MMRHEQRHRRQQLPERVDHPGGRAVLVGGGVSDRLADMFIEELHSPVGEAAHRPIGVPRQREQVPERKTELEQAKRVPHQLDVTGRVPRLTVDVGPDPDPLALHRLDQRGRYAARGSEGVEREELTVDRVDPFGRHGRGEARIGEPELAVDHPADRGEGQTLLLKGSDLVDPVDVLGPVPGDASFLVRLRQQPAGLVVANRVDRHLARRGELLDSIPHDRELYECSLTGSSASIAHGPEHGRRGSVDTMPSVDGAPTGVGLGASAGGAGGPTEADDHPRTRAGVPRGHPADRRRPEGSLRRR